MNELMLWLQDAPADAPSLILALAAVVIPGVATWAAMKVAALLKITDAWGDVSKRLLAVAFSYAATLLNRVVPGLDYPLELSGLTAPAIEGVLNFGLSQALFLIFKKKPS